MGVGVRGYDRLVMNLEYLVFKIEQRNMQKKKKKKKKRVSNVPVSCLFLVSSVPA